MILISKLLTAALTALANPVDAETVSSASNPAEPSNAVVVIELFTSQSCGMCPGANALLGELAGDGEHLALAYGVNYWDEFYGWPDQFARPEFVARQEDYVSAGQANRVFTPHFVVNGAPERLRFKETRIRTAVNEAETLPAFIAANEDRVDLSGPERAAPALVWQVSYKAGAEDAPVEGGPNQGVTMNHFNMVRAIEPLGEWAGGDASFPLADVQSGLSRAILVQEGVGGVIVSAARLD